MTAVLLSAELELMGVHVEREYPWLASADLSTVKKSGAAELARLAGDAHGLDQEDRAIAEATVRLTLACATGDLHGVVVAISHLKGKRPEALLLQARGHLLQGHLGFLGNPDGEYRAALDILEGLEHEVTLKLLEAAEAAPSGVGVPLSDVLKRRGREIAELKAEASAGLARVYAASRVANDRDLVPPYLETARLTASPRLQRLADRIAESVAPRSPRIAASR